MSFSYRGFPDTDIYNLVSTKQAEALGHGSGVAGALNWIDRCPRAVGIKLEGNAREIFINEISPIIEYRIYNDKIENDRYKAFNEGR